MTARRWALLALAALALPPAAWSEPLPKPPAQSGRPAGQAAKPASRAVPAAGKAAPASRAPSVAQGRAAKPVAEKPAGGKPGRAEATTEATPRAPVPAREDGPSLRPLDRDLVRQWLLANPDWRPTGRPLAVAAGRPLPPGLPRRPLPPELAVLLPYFPGYRYAAVGPDLVLYASGTEVVASLLAGALANEAGRD